FRSGTELYATRRLLGWSIRGPLYPEQGKCARSKSNHEIETIIRDMYNEEFKDNARLGKEWSVDDVTTVRLVEQSCKYEDGLPWKLGGKVMSCNRDLAFKRLQNVEARFKTYPELWVRYKEVIHAHFTKGYVERVSMEPLGKWYLPHHPVVKSRKTSKVRVVFDYSAKFNEVSLNDMLLSGPNSVSPLLGVLLRFRQSFIAIAADIEEMFLQGKIPEGHRDYLRFLW
ncbi:Gag-Pol polyprotein, partial [Schistosoma japonicum]